MKKDWIVVANRAGARIFKKNPFVLVKALQNQLGREKNRAMTTDKPGWSRSKLAKPSSTHALTGEKDPHEDAAIQFARELSHYLKHQLPSRLKIVAEPKMIGYIRKFLDPHLGSNVEWIRKDLSHFTDHEIGKAFGFDFRKYAREHS